MRIQRPHSDLIVAALRQHLKVKAQSLATLSGMPAESFPDRERMIENVQHELDTLNNYIQALTPTTGPEKRGRPKANTGAAAFTSFDD